MLNFINIAYAHSGDFGDGPYMMHDFGMMGGAGSFIFFLMWLSVFVLVVLGIVALAKYVFASGFGANKVDKNKYFKCPECGFEYEDEEWAKKCQEWCSEHKSCNLEITKHSRQHKNSKK